MDERTFEQIKNIEMAHEAWKKLEESFEGTQAMKGAKAYIFKEKFASFKMKEDESVPEMFHWLQVLVNDLRALREEVKDKDFSHKFLRCLPSRFGTLMTILVRRPTVERARSTRERLILGMNGTQLERAQVRRMSRLQPLLFTSHPLHQGSSTIYPMMTTTFLIFVLWQRVKR